MNNALNEIHKTKSVPKTNKNMNEKLFKREEDFLVRQENDYQRLLEKKKKIEDQIYSNLFNPAIHRDKQVEPQVYKKHTIYKDLQNTVRTKIR